jgi:ABC-type nitrate/sulfonate/bicarbonate transport system substrate-binding protein
MSEKNIWGGTGLLLPLVLVIFGLVIGCGNQNDVVLSEPPKSLVNNPSNDPVGPKVTVLRVPSSSEPTSPINFMVAQETGIAAKHHIDFEYLGVVPAPQLVAAVVGGRIDTNPPTHINRTIAGISAGAKIMSVVASSETSQRIPHMVGIVNKNSKIRKPSDLVGKNIGITTVGGCHEYTPYAYLTKNGILDSKNKVHIHIIPLSGIEQALRQGEIDLAMMHKVPAEVIRQGEFDIVFSDYDVWETIGGATPHFFTHQYIKDNPEVIRNFVATMSETVNWTNSHPQEAREITARRAKSDINLVNEGFYAADGIIKPVTVQVWIDLLEEYGEIKPGITLDQIFTNEFNPNFKPGA